MSLKIILIPSVTLLFLFAASSATFAQCPGGYVDCGASLNCPGARRCCTFGAYGDACTAEGATCTSWPNCIPACDANNPCANNCGISNACSGGLDCCGTFCNNGNCENLCQSSCGAPPSVSVVLTPIPASGQTPLNNVDMTADVGGTALGDIRYRFDCTNDGTYEADITSTNDPYTRVDLCNYVIPGTYTVRVSVDRQGVVAEDTALVSVTGLICNQSCVLNSQCTSAGLFCDIGVSNTCRQLACPTSTNCICPTPAPTPVVSPSPSPSPSPTPTGTIQARVIEVDPVVNSCPLTAIAGLNSTVTFSGPSSTSGPVSGLSYNQFTGRNIGLYTISETVPAGDYTYRNRCVAANLTGPGTISTDNSILTTSGLTWDIGYSRDANGWLQVRGGNVHSNQNISLNIPVSNYFLIPESSTLKSGIVSFKDTATFTSAAATPTPINNGFLVDENAAHPKAVSYYTYFNSKLGNVTFSTISAKPDGNPITCPSIVDGTCVYKTADLTIQTAPWNVASGERLVIFVSRQLTIGTAIIVRDGGFIAFIVNDDLTVADDILILTTVGYPDPYVESSAITNPITQANISGLYITDGRLRTAGSIGNRQLIAAGTFVANDFRFERNLGASNDTYPGELFIYRPDLWRNAPEVLKEIEIGWQEVAP